MVLSVMTLGEVDGTPSAPMPVLTPYLPSCPEFSLFFNAYSPPFSGSLLHQPHLTQVMRMALTHEMLWKLHPVPVLGM